MVTYRKVYDPGETSRRLNLIVRLPETLAGLSETPYRQEALLIDHILRQWVLSQIGAKSLDQAVEDGTLRTHIGRALDQAKEDRQTVAPTKGVASSGKAAKPTRSASTGGAPAKVPAVQARNETKPEIPETETVTPDTKPVTGAVTKPVTHLPTEQSHAVEGAVASNKEPSKADENSRKEAENQQTPSNEQEEVQPPPSITNRFNSMFEDF